MKQLITILILFLSLAQFSNAQSNFGKRKFPRNLFSRNIHLPLKEDSSTIIPTKRTKVKKMVAEIHAENESDTRIENEIIAEESESNLEILTELEDTLLAVENVIDLKKKDLTLKKHTEPFKFNHGMMERAETETFQKTFNEGMTKNEQAGESNKSSLSNEFRENIYIFLGYLLAAAACAIYLLLLYYFPVFTAILTIILLIIGFVVLLKELFDLFSDFIFMMG